MPFWIDGGIEAARLVDDQLLWQGVIRLGPLIDVSDALSERLFGLSKRFVSGEGVVSSIAASRGLPADPSPELQHDLAAIRQVEAMHAFGDFGGFTHATWAETQAFLDKAAVDRADSDWNLALDLMERIARDERFAEDRVRAVVWYNW